MPPALKANVLDVYSIQMYCMQWNLQCNKLCFIMHFHMFSSDCSTSMDMIWVMIATSIFANSIELKNFWEPEKSLLRAHQKIPVPQADCVFRAPLFRLSDYMFFIRTSVQAIEPWLCFIVIFPGGYLSNLFFCIFFAKVFFFMITSIFNFPNWNLRMKAFAKFCADILDFQVTVKIFTFPITSFRCFLFTFWHYFRRAGYQHTHTLNSMLLAE